MVFTAAPVAARTSGDPAARRREVKQRQAEVAAKLDVLRASDRQVDQALSSLETDVAAQRAAVESARQAADVAERAAADARRQESAKVAEVAALDARVKALAVESYVSPGGGDLLTALRANDLADVSRKRAYLELGQVQGRQVLDEAKAAREDLTVRRQAAERAREAARARRAQVEGRLSGLRSSLARQQAFAGEVQNRLDAALGEAASLASLDKELAAEIARRNELLAQRARALSPRPSRASRSGTFRGGGNVSLTTVRGITVATSIADNLENLLAAAESDGFVFSGGGYRDSSGQVAARRANCGTSDYATYEMPPSQCSPPTARPGTSMHEQGLAIDFTWQGRIISSRSSPAYAWLSRNASRFGLYNLPSEPWHWSTNGN